MSEYIDITIRAKVVWSLNEWQKREDILVERKVPRKPMDIVRDEREQLSQAVGEHERVSWAWKHPA